MKSRNGNHKRTSLSELEQRLSALETRVQDDLGAGNVSRNKRRQRASRRPRVVPLHQLARAGLLLQQRTDYAIRFAIRKYLDATDDLQLLNRSTMEAREKEKLRARFRRWQQHCEKDLESLGVSVTPVEPGVEFNPSVHQLHRKQPAPRAEQLHTVAIAKSPFFTWRDVEGQPQIEPAKVVVYTDCAPAAHLAGQAEEETQDENTL